MAELRNALLGILLGALVLALLGRSGVLGLGPHASKALVWATLAAAWLALTAWKHKPERKWMAAHPIGGLLLFILGGALLGLTVWVPTYVAARKEAAPAIPAPTSPAPSADTLAQ